MESPFLAAAVTLNRPHSHSRSCWSLVSTTFKNMKFLRNYSFLNTSQVQFDEAFIGSFTYNGIVWWPKENFIKYWRMKISSFIGRTKITLCVGVAKIASHVGWLKMELHVGRVKIVSYALTEWKLHQVFAKWKWNCLLAEWKWHFILAEWKLHRLSAKWKWNCELSVWKWHRVKIASHEGRVKIILYWPSETTWGVSQVKMDLWHNYCVLAEWKWHLVVSFHCQPSFFFSEILYTSALKSEIFARMIK